MKKEVITFREPKSPISEIFRTLRTNIQFMNTKRSLKSILVTSTSPAEGKSWVTTNLAVAFAQAGKKVILVDCDLRKGRQFSLFNVAPTPGLSNYLSGISSNGEDSSTNILSYIKETEVENLYLIPAGNIPPNPSELLVSEQMAEAVENLKQICDLVIFDGTPSSLVTDAVIVSRYVDTTLIVAAYNKTKYEDLEKVKRDIENVGGKIAGVVINKVPVSQKEYYSTYYYGNSNIKMKSANTVKKKTKEETQLEVEYKREIAREKAKQILKQNKEENNNTKTQGIYDVEKEENAIITVEPNKEYVVEGIKFKTIPAYNTNKTFHPKGNDWVGYIITINNIRYYIAGDTDITEENKKVKCDVAFVPVGGTYTMDFKEAAQLINEIQPKIAIPIHYGSVVGTNQDATDFVKLLNPSIKGIILMKQ